MALSTNAQARGRHPYWWCQRRITISLLRRRPSLEQYHHQRRVSPATSRRNTEVTGRCPLLLYSRPCQRLLASGTRSRIATQDCLHDPDRTVWVMPLGLCNPPGIRSDVSWNWYCAGHTAKHASFILTTHTFYCEGNHGAWLPYTTFNKRSAHFPWNGKLL